jgi:hypothetical protein
MRRRIGPDRAAPIDPPRPKGIARRAYSIFGQAAAFTSLLFTSTGTDGISSLLIKANSWRVRVSLILAFGLECLDSDQRYGPCIGEYFVSYCP